jgi:hypothetical protein
MFETVFAIALVLTAMTRSLEGTLMAINDGKTAEITLNADRQFQTFPVAKRAVVERESRSATNDGPAKTARIALPDLTPGEFVRLQIDPQGRVTRAHAIVRVERAKVRSASGNTIVLEDGTTFTIGSVLRFVGRNGKASAMATVRAGDIVLLFHHPETGNVYRISAEPRVRVRNRAE